MTTITTRSGKGSALTHAEVDANFENLNTDKVETSAIGTTVQAYDANLTTFVTSFTLPTTDGTADQVLKTDGSGTLSFATAAAAGGATGGGSDQVFYENGQTVTTSYTITTGSSAMSAGPITINSGITVTVPTGSRWVVV